MIVLVIFGTVAAIGMPRFSAQVRHTRVNQAARVVAADLERAAAISAERRVPVRLTYHASNGEYVLADRRGAVLMRRPLGIESEWKLSAVNFAPRSVEFFPGGITSTPLTVQLTSADYARRVTMTRAGFVRVVR